jgi:hypothetical protein
MKNVSLALNGILVVAVAVSVLPAFFFRKQILQVHLLTAAVFQPTLR